VARAQAKRLVEQRIAVRAGDRGPLAWQRQRDLFVRMVPIASRDEVLAPHGEHRPAESFGAKELAPSELPNLRVPLTRQVLVALDWCARRRDEPTGRKRSPFLRLKLVRAGAHALVVARSCPVHSTPAIGTRRPELRPGSRVHSRWRQHDGPSHRRSRRRALCVRFLGRPCDGRRAPRYGPGCAGRRSGGRGDRSGARPGLRRDVRQRAR
jgi:hypothetical protein